MKVGPGEFFVVGPSRMAHVARHLPGALLLCKEADGLRTESMYFITPRVIQTVVNRDMNGMPVTEQ